MAQTPTVTHYEVLDVPATADAAEIKKAYQKRVRSSHPDVGGSAGLFRLVQDAYDTLSDPSRRAAYDRSLGDATKDAGSAPPPRQEPREEARQEKRQDPPRQQPRTEPSFQKMETPPPAPAWDGADVEFRPPLSVAPWDGKKVRLPVSNGIRLWRKVLLIIGGIMCIFPVISTVVAIGMYAGSKAFATMALTGALGIVLTAGFWYLIAMTPWWFARRKKTPPAPVLAGSILPESYITTKVHGNPGRDLSVARFGANAKIGIEGEERTARLITESVLPGLPSARLINGLRWPGTEHADIDHAVVAGNRIALIDSKMWADGDYWWDNKRLFRNGQELEALKLGSAVSAMRAAYPHCQVEGWVVVHSPSGKLSKPSVERAGMLAPIGKTAIYLTNAAELPAAVHAYLAGGEDSHAVEVPVLASLLHSML